jgi:hypothetical protein
MFLFCYGHPMQVVKDILEKIEKDIQASSLNDSFSKK